MLRLMVILAFCTNLLPLLHDSPSPDSPVSKVTGLPVPQLRFGQSSLTILNSCREGQRLSRTGHEFIHNLRKHEPVPEAGRTDADLIHNLRNNLLSDKSKDG